MCETQLCKWMSWESKNPFRKVGQFQMRNKGQFFTKKI